MKNKVKITTEKKFKASLYSGVDQALRAWFKGNRARKVPISGDLLLAKAADIARSVNLNPPSMGFINSFKKRHEILFRRIHGESGDADEQGKEEWLKENLPLIMSYAPSDVYNMDETGLFFRALPSGTLCFKEEVVKGTKTSKDRITLAVTVNMDGSYKELLAIGKSANPRCFRKKPPVLPYMATSKAWQTVKTFKGWIKEFDNRRRLQNKHVILLLDNAPVHIHERHTSLLGEVTPKVNLTNTTVIMLPPNSTSILQPCDQGIIRCHKGHYRKLLCQKILARMDRGEIDSVKKMNEVVSLSDALMLARMAWEKVTPKSISNCWKHGGFWEGPMAKSQDEDYDSAEDDDEMLEENDHINVPVDEEVLLRMGLNEEDYVNFVEIDTNDPGMFELNDENLAAIAQEESDHDSGSDEEEEDDPLWTGLNCVLAMKEILRYAVSKEASNDELYAIAYAQDTLSKLSKKNLKQPPITEFFKPRVKEDDDDDLNLDFL